jgi:hypothetical protein
VATAAANPYPYYPQPYYQPHCGPPYPTSCPYP